MAIITPRLMVVEGVTSVGTLGAYNHIDTNQNLSLILLNRSQSSEIENAFLKGQERNLGKILSYAKRNEIQSLDGALTKIDHKKAHQVQGEKYSLGDVITEKEAFDFGYVEPHIETLCVRIGKLAQEKGASQDSDELTPALRQQGLIAEQYLALLSGGILEIVHSSRGKEFRLQRVNEKNRADHPITLKFYTEDNGAVRAACSFYHGNTRTIYEFMTTIP